MYCFTTRLFQLTIYTIYNIKQYNAENVNITDITANYFNSTKIINEFPRKQFLYFLQLNELSLTKSEIKHKKL